MHSLVGMLILALVALFIFMPVNRKAMHLATMHARMFTQQGYKLAVGEIDWSRPLSRNEIAPAYCTVHNGIVHGRELQLFAFKGNEKVDVLAFGGIVPRWRAFNLRRALARTTGTEVGITGTHKMYNGKWV